MSESVRIRYTRKLQPAQFEPKELEIERTRNFGEDEQDVEGQLTSLMRGTIDLVHDGLGLKKPKHKSEAPCAPVGPRGGQNKKPPPDDKIYLYSFLEYGEGGKINSVTKEYNRTVRGLRGFVDDLEASFMIDPGIWDVNDHAGMIDIVKKGIDTKGLADLRDRVSEMEARVQEMGEK